MALDLQTVVTTGSISAIVATVASLLTTSWKIGREDRAKRALVAKARIREATEDVLLTAAARAAEPDEPVIEKAPVLSAYWRYAFASKVMAASEDLPWHRRWLVRRRTRKLAGHAISDAALIVPASDPEESVSLVISAMLKSPDADHKGTLSQLKTNTAKPNDLRRLLRSLKRLRNAR